MENAWNREGPVVKRALPGCHLRRWKRERGALFARAVSPEHDGGDMDLAALRRGTGAKAGCSRSMRGRLQGGHGKGCQMLTPRCGFDCADFGIASPADVRVRRTAGNGQPREQGKQGQQETRHRQPI